MEQLVSLDTGLIFWTWATFLIVLVILAWKAWGPMIEALDRREQTIRESLEAADKARSEAEVMTSKFEEQLRAGRQEAQQVLAEARTLAEKVRLDIETTAGKRADEIIAKAKEQIETEKARALQEIRSEVVDLSLSIATKVLERNITSEDNRKLAEQSLKQIGRA